MRYFTFPLLALLLMACTPVDRVLPQDDGTWQLTRMIYEYNLDFDNIVSIDTVDQGPVVFRSDGNGYWQNDWSPSKTDSVNQDLFTWSVIEEGDEVVMTFEEPLADFGNVQSVTFQVLENERDRQLWRADITGKAYNPLRSDSSDLAIRWQWTLTQ